MSLLNLYYYSGFFLSSHCWKGDDFSAIPIQSWWNFQPHKASRDDITLEEAEQNVCVFFKDFFVGIDCWLDEAWG